MIYEAVRNLVQYGLEAELIEKEDAIYARNQIISVLGLNEYEEPDAPAGNVSLEETLKELLDYAAAKGLLRNRHTRSGEENSGGRCIILPTQ